MHIYAALQTVLYCQFAFIYCNVEILIIYNVKTLSLYIQTHHPYLQITINNPALKLQIEALTSKCHLH